MPATPHRIAARTRTPSARVYVEGESHTNTIEGFFGLLKNGVLGVYDSISTAYLHNYLDEYGLRYNARNSSNPMFLADRGSGAEGGSSFRLASSEVAFGGSSRKSASVCLGSIFSTTSSPGTGLGFFWVLGWRQCLCASSGGIFTVLLTTAEGVGIEPMALSLLGLILRRAVRYTANVPPEF